VPRMTVVAQFGVAALTALASLGLPAATLAQTTTTKTTTTAAATTHKAGTRIQKSAQAAKPAAKPAGATTSTAKPPTPVKPAAAVKPAVAGTAAPTRTSVATSRAVAVARARLAASQRQQFDAMTPRFKRDDLGNLIPDVRAAAAIVYNPQTGEVLWEENSHDQRSIASITKVMTAVTFLADGPDLSQRVAVTATDMRNASTTHIRTGQILSYDDLLHLLLIASDNAAARVLARTSEGGTAAFVGRMNEMAVHLGLTNTHYTDPSGLESTNVSSAYDLSHLIAFAASDATIGSVMRTETYEAHASTGPIPIHSTNKLLGTDVDVRGGKTGFIAKSGYCLATLLQIPQGSQVAVVVLGAANSMTRFWEARHLFNWVVGRAQGLTGGDDPDELLAVPPVVK
jgi:serine-type D-Ala-D-Ala endopeptidase (penicillin-binding protein 7)